MLFLPDGGLDHGGVEGVGDQADDEVVLGHLGVEGGVVVNVERDGGRVLHARGQLLGRLEGAACCFGSSRQVRSCFRFPGARAYAS